ncbi:magnesium transporter [Natronocella acetinitrilica]|uniref:Magnesium transporter MgtE n=1 Tax=Natronocella acetinitrilica TaxID=414046 RepID=A0AAE3KDA1_9GAMM|nr:magnesium transporter [Natronocella acetinitrilica]MCP1676624.1 magnesium transporter [Natronocella acetinitrilica]
MLLVTSTLEQYAHEMAQHLEQSGYREAARAARKVSSRRAAAILMEAPRHAVVPFLQTLGWDRAGQIAAHLPRDYAAKLLTELSVDDASSLIAAMSPEVIAALMERLPPDQAQPLLDELDQGFRAEIETVARYPADSAGAVMSPYFLSVDEGATVGETTEAVREAPSDTERGAYVFVVGSGGRLAGVISLRELLMAANDSVIRDVMARDVLAARVTDEAQDAAQRIRTRRLKLLPVVDEQDVLVGVMTMNQAMDLVTERIADEFTAVNAASVDETFFTPPREAIRKRLPWMAANIFLNLGAVAVISSFEATLVQVAILAAFLPMITDMGGNVGIQALSVSIRSMALGEVRVRDFWIALRKEVAIGIFNGIALGALFTVLAWFMEGNMILGLVAGTALAVNVLLAGVVGGTIPFLIKRLGKDPAMMTGPILTTITDITGVSVYLGLATVFLAGLMGGV